MADDEEVGPPSVLPADLTALIGWLAVIQSEIMIRELPEPLQARLVKRFVDVGLLAPDGDERAFRQAIDDLDHRLRYVLGE